MLVEIKGNFYVSYSHQDFNLTQYGVSEKNTILPGIIFLRQKKTLPPKLLFFSILGLPTTQK
jgi:hypothetical protein